MPIQGSAESCIVKLETEGFSARGGDVAQLEYETVLNRDFVLTLCLLRYSCHVKSVSVLGLHPFPIQ
jgi:hypothetical protein